MNRFRLAATIAALSLSLGAPAMAETAKLRYDDLDLASPAGQAELASRIDAVAAKACPMEGVTGSRLPQREERQACIAEVKRQIQTRLAGKIGSNLATAGR